VEEERLRRTGLPVRWSSVDKVDIHISEIQSEKFKATQRGTRTISIDITIL